MRYALKQNLMNLSAVAADVRSDVLDIRNLDKLAFHVSWTATTASATVKIEASNDKDAATWVALSTTQAINNDNGDKMIEINTAAYAYVRVFLDWSSGSVTTFKCHFSGKGL